MKKYYMFLLLLVVSTSCNNNFKYYNVPDENRTVLVNNDTICFQDSANISIDTFCVKIFSFYSYSDSYSAAENIFIDYNMQNIKASISYFNITQTSIGVYIRINHPYYYYWYINSDDSYNNIQYNYNAHGVTYPKVFV